MNKALEAKLKAVEEQLSELVLKQEALTKAANVASKETSNGVSDKSPKDKDVGVRKPLFTLYKTLLMRQHSRKRAKSRQRRFVDAQDTVDLH